jgi:tRNA 2-thiocytidine biosynthesis protein TtcA
MDRALFDFSNLKANGAPLAEGDIAFDEEPCANNTAGNNSTEQIIKLQN